MGNLGRNEREHIYVHICDRFREHKLESVVPVGVKSELFVLIFATYHEIWISYNGFYIHIHVAMASAFV